MATSLDFNFQEVRDHAVTVLQKAFPNSAITSDEGWNGRVHLKIVSSAFDGKSEKAKQAIVWDVLRSELQSESEGVSLVLVYGMDEL